MSLKPVLVVEDDRDIRDQLEEILRGERYPVQTARNGQEALERLRSATEIPGLILLDLYMPVMSGRTFLEVRNAERHQVWANVPIVILSAANEKLPDTASGHLKKPVELDDLLETVGAFCNVVD